MSTGTGRPSLIARDDSTPCRPASPALTAMSLDVHQFGVLVARSVLEPVDGAPRTPRWSPPVRHSPDRMDEVFTDDVVYDLADFGRGSLRGRTALREAALALGDANPVGHHVTNIVLSELADGRVRALSKGIGITADGGCASVTYEDTVERVEQGRRITYRKVTARRKPLGG